jgi:hypothetical protein
LETFTAGAETTAVWSVVQWSSVPSDLRFEPEYHQPKYLSLEKTLSRIGCDRLENLALNINSGPFGSNLLKSLYVDDGVIVLRPFNIENATVEDENLVFISQADCEAQGLPLYKARDVAFARVGDIRCGIIPDFGKPVTISPNIIVAQLDERRINPYFLATFMNTALGFSQLERAIKVVAQPTITVETVKFLSIPRISQREQLEVERMLRASFQMRQDAKALYAEAEALLLAELGMDELDLSHQSTYTQSFSQAWAVGRMDAEYFQPKYYRVLEAISSTAEGKEWPIKKIGQFSEPLKYGTSTKLEYLQEGVPFLRIADVSRRRFSLDSVQYISGKQAEEEKRASVRTGDVLISRSGTLGLTVAIPAYLEGAIFGSYFIRARPDDKRVVPKYLALFMNSLAGQTQVERLNTGAIQTNLTIPAIESIQVPLPPLEVQKAIAGKVLDSFAAEDEAKRLLEEAKRRVEELVLREES